MNRFCAILSGVLAGFANTASGVVKGDTSVLGDTCIGFDCVNNEAFSADEVIKLKENNTRISWIDTTAGLFETRDNRDSVYFEGEVGRIWWAEANESANGGRNYFYINQRSATPSPALSDGTALDYDCTTVDLELPFPHYPVVGTIPEGEPAETSSCTSISDVLVLEALVLDGVANGGVGLGQESVVETGTVALGNQSFLRRLARVADAIQQTDVLIKSQMDTGVLLERVRAANEIEALLDLAEAEISELEQQVAPQSGSNRGNGGIGSAMWLLALAPLLVLRLTARIRSRQ